MSPTFIERSNKSIMPLAKLLTMFCRPKPIPMPKAPNITVRLCIPTPVVEKNIKTLRVMKK